MRLPNSYGSVYKLSGNRRKPWAVRKTKLRDNGQGQPVYDYLGYFETRTEALNFLSEYNVNPYDPNIKKLTTEDIYERWTKQRYKDDKIPNNYRAAWQACTVVHSALFNELKASHIQKCIDAWQAGPMSKKNMKTLFSFLYRYAVSNDIVDKDYSQFLEIPTIEQSKLHTPFSEEEIKILWDNQTDKAAQYVLVLIYTGMRPTELIRMLTKEIYLDDKYMIGGIKTAAGKHRAIPIADKIFPIIQSLYNPSNEMLMTDYDGPLNYDKFKGRYWDPIMAKLGMAHYPHDGRHTCATLLDNAEANKTVIKRILGHAGAGTTEKVYTHKTIQQLLDAINKI